MIPLEAEIESLNDFCIHSVKKFKQRIQHL
jgi:hypothetical protein